MSAAGSPRWSRPRAPVADPAPLRERIDAALREVIDPEIGLDVVELGLVYGVALDGADVAVQLTMTTAACPLGEQILEDATTRLQAVSGIGVVHVELVWEPPWSPDRMSPAAKELLGWSA
ncbi:MAG: metal-sulfur cluster assembly factor [Myxococcales bacterium]|nr:metal-sulfur cluster assembly factor [Myxococcales bacterium]